MKAICVKNIFMGGKNYPPGSTIEIDSKEESERLLKLKAIQPVETEPKAKKK